MFSYDLLIPWITLAATLVPLLYVQRWIHRHVFGVGFLLSREKRAATLFYYLFLLPGVILHELSAYLMAGVFNVPSTRFTIYPEAQEDGSLESGFVQLEEVKNPIFATFIGIAPLVTGMLVVVLIGNSLLDLPGFLAQLRTGDLSKIGPAIQALITRPDFLFWTYILFAVANAMMPNAEDRRGWWYVGIVSVGLLLFMTVLGLQKIVVAWLTGPIAGALYSLSAVFGVVLLLDCLAMALIWAVEGLLERVTGHRIEYQPSKPSALTAPQAPRPAINSVYELNLPLPPLPGKITATPAPRLNPATERPAIGAGSPQPARPALAASSTGAVPGGRPAWGSGASASSGSGGFGGSGGTGERSAPPALPARPAAGSASSLAGSRSTGTSPTPFGQPSRPAALPAGDQAERSERAEQPPKPAGPFGQPAKPAPTPGQPTGQPPRPGTPFGQPSRPAAASTEDTGKLAATSRQPAQPAQPGTSFGQPAKPAPTPSQPTGQPPRPGTPFGQPAKPAQPGTSFGQPAKPAPTPGQQTGQPPRPGTPFGQPSRPAAASNNEDTGKLAATSRQPAQGGTSFGQPAKPGTPFGQPAKPAPTPGQPTGQPPRPGTPFGQPAKPASPNPGTSALARPNVPPGPAGARSPFGPSPKPGDSGRSRFGGFDKNSDDVIDGDVIDDEIDNQDEPEPGFMRGVNKPSNDPKTRSPFGSRADDEDDDNKGNKGDEDDNEPKYVDIDDV